LRLGIPLAFPLPLGGYRALVVNTDETGGEPPLDGASHSGTTAPAIRVTEALAVARVVDALNNPRGHTTSVQPLVPARAIQLVSRPGPHAGSTDHVSLRRGHRRDVPARIHPAAARTAMHPWEKRERRWPPHHPYRLSPFRAHSHAAVRVAHAGEGWRSVVSPTLTDEPNRRPLVGTIKERPWRRSAVRQPGAWAQPT
jgi:hypothetical protein